MSGKYSVELLEDPYDSDVQKLAAMLGLRKVGQANSDQLDDGNVRSCDYHVTLDWLDIH